MPSLIAPAIARDRPLYSVTRAHFFPGNRHGFLVAINRDLSLKWAASLRNRFHDGCGVSPAQGGTLRITADRTERSIRVTAGRSDCQQLSSRST